MPTDAITLRAATAADADAIAALLGELGHATAAPDLPARLEALRHEGGAAMLAVDAHGTALGLVTLAAHAVLHASGPVGLITALVVTGRARGRGVGRRLVDASIAWAARRGCVRLVVTSAERRADAHAFYPACGMPYTGRRFATTITPSPAGVQHAP